MSISKRVAEAIEKLAASDPEGALLPISTALDATATKHFGRRGRTSYKDFIYQNLELISRIAFGPTIQNLNLKYEHPELPETPDNMHSIQDILYHVVRCSLTHSAELPSSLIFTNEGKLEVREGRLVFPDSLIYGIIVAVVVCPANSDQSISSGYRISMSDNSLELNDFWGQREKLDQFYVSRNAI